MKLNVKVLSLALVLLLAIVIACAASTEVSAGRRHLMQTDDSGDDNGGSDSSDSEGSDDSGNDADSGGDDSTSAAPAADTAVDAKVDQALTSGNAAALTTAAQAAQKAGDTSGIQSVVTSNLQDSSAAGNTLTTLENAPQNSGYASGLGITNLPDGGVSNAAVQARLAALKKAVSTNSQVIPPPASGRKLQQFSNSFIIQIYAQALSQSICQNPQAQGPNLCRAITSRNRDLATATARGIKFAANQCCFSTTRAVYAALLNCINSGRGDRFIARMNVFKPKIGISSCAW